MQTTLQRQPPHSAGNAVGGSGSAYVVELDRCSWPLEARSSTEREEKRERAKRHAGVGVVRRRREEGERNIGSSHGLRDKRTKGEHTKCVSIAAQSGDATYLRRKHITEAHLSRV